MRLVIGWFFRLLDGSLSWAFNGIVQLWDVEPRNPEEWVKISYPNIGEGWLHLDSLPDSNQEWVIMLIAGPIVHPILILFGILLSIKQQNRHV
jgi:hypothetical protein